MTPLVAILTIAIYFAVLFTVSYLAGRRADNAGFFVGGRQSKWYMVAFAMIGASISGVTFVSVPGMVGASQMGYLQMVLGFVAGQLAIAFVLTPLFYKMQLTSIYQFLEDRLGKGGYHSGAWMFFISKMLGASVRLFVVCLMMQLLIFTPLGLPFALNALVTMIVVWLYTFRGGVKSLIWTDSLKTLCLLLSLFLCIWYIAKDLHFSAVDVFQNITGSEWSRIFFFDNPNEKQYFWKQFLAGAFTMIATNGLDQDMMQRNLSCKNPRDAQKNMIVSILLQLVVIWIFLGLGVLLYLFAREHGITVAKSDELFPTIATGGYLPLAVGIIFVVGLTSAAFAAAGSALTALTTSFTVDIWGTKGKTEAAITTARKKIHIGMAVLMGLCIVAFNILNNTSVIDAVYVLASYTYGPILGMFAFAIFTKRKVRHYLVPLVVIVSPILCYVIDSHSEAWLGGYQFSYELLIMNALFTFIGLCLISTSEGEKKSALTAIALVIGLSLGLTGCRETSASEEPNVEVGILLEQQAIRFRLLGDYRMADGQKVTGEQTVMYENGHMTWNSTTQDELLFTPTQADNYIEIEDVIIGVDFHWERREQQRFQGALKLIVEEKGLTAVNLIPVEDYLLSVISSEMSAQASLEFLKAHAVISRSWLLNKMKNEELKMKNEELKMKNEESDSEESSSLFTPHSSFIKWYESDAHQRFHVCADDHCQRYQGITRVTTEKAREAIEATRGQVLTYNGEICDTRYSKSCGGAFEEFHTAWADKDLPYLLKGRDLDVMKNEESGTESPLPDLTIEEEADKWIRTAPASFCNTDDKQILAQVLNNYDQETIDFYRWQVNYSQAELSALIKERSGIDFGDILDLQPVERGTSGRLCKLRIVGSKQTLVIGKELEIRRTLSTSHLFSSAFVVDKTYKAGSKLPDTFTLTGAGWGHGVGLCQIGAAVMGEQGYAYEDILEHYYQGTTIENAY